MSRVVLLGVTGILTAISRKFLFDTVAQSTARGVHFSSPLGATITRVGFGAFPLACAIVVVLCLVAAERVRLGLWFVVALFGTVLVVRVLGAMVDGSMAESVPLVIPEVAVLTLTCIVLAIGGGQPAIKGDGGV